MPVLDALCRRYQSLFGCSHPEEARLVGLAAGGYSPEYLRAYFDHESEKGAAAVARFAAIAPVPAGPALDFGCGAGGLTFRIAAAAGEATGIDIGAEKLAFAEAERATRAGHVRFVQYGGGTPLPFPDGAFASAWCVDVVEHLPTPALFLAELGRVLRPGGLLYLSFGPPWGHAHGKHLWAKLPGGWTHLLFPRAVCMRVGGYPEDATWEDLGLHRLTVGGFRRAARGCGLRPVHYEEKVKRAVAPLRLVPGVRELVIGEVVAVYRKPD